MSSFSSRLDRLSLLCDVTCRKGHGKYSHIQAHQQRIEHVQRLLLVQDSPLVCLEPEIVSVFLALPLASSFSPLSPSSLPFSVSS